MKKSTDGAITWSQTTSGRYAQSLMQTVGHHLYLFLVPERGQLPGRPL